MITDLKTLCASVVALVKETGQFLLRENNNFDRAHIELKDRNNLVSYVDKTAEQQLVEGLKKLFPAAGFIAEEGTAGEEGQDYLWIIDPLDGTTNFSHKLPVYAISIGLSYKGEHILGVVYDPSRDECFSAWKDGGAYLNDKTIKVSAVPTLEESLLATGFPYYLFEQLENYISILKILMQQTHGLRRMGSAAIDLCYVACGRFEGFFEYNLKAYDVAAGTIIVREAGGTVTDFAGANEKHFSGEEIIASNTLVTKSLTDIIKGQWQI